MARSVRRSPLFVILSAGSGSAWTRRIATVTSLALVLSLAEIPVQQGRALAAPPAPPAAPAKPVCPADRPDQTSAAVAAKLCGGRVEVSGLLSETTQVWANPDGTLTSERHLAPVRVRQNNRWVPVDLTLQRLPDGSVAPTAHPQGLRLSGAVGGTGSHELSSVGAVDQRLALTWAGTLPEPVLAGATATYRDVRPDVDLVVTATRTGYEQSFVVRTRAGLAQARRLALGVDAGSLTVTADGSGALLLKDKAGREVGRSHPAQMWDAAVSPESLERVNRAPVALTATAAGPGRLSVELVPDEAFVSRSDLRFPVTIDPPATLVPLFDAFVQTDYVSDQSGSVDLKLGFSDDGGVNRTARSFLKFDSSGLWDQGVISATLNLWEYHSWSCTAASWEAWRTSDVGSWVRWTAQPTFYELIGTSSQTRGYTSSCADGWVSIGVTGGFQTAASSHLSTLSIGIKASSETNHLGWKRFDSTEGTHDPYVSITYNAPPNLPASLTVAPCFTSCGSGAATSASRPSLSATLSDPNAGDSVRAEFEVWNSGHTAVVASSGLTSAIASGATASWQVGTDLVNGVGYEWRVRAFDGRNYSAWSAWTAMTVDTDRPGVPFVSATLYLNDGSPHGGAGVSDQFTFTPATGTTDLAAFVYQLDTSPTSTTVPATTATTVTITPPADGHRTLTVWAKDRAGNQSNANVYAFQVGAAALAQPLPGANVIKRTKLAVDSVVPQYTRGYFEYRRGPGGAVLPVPSANLTTATGAAVTATAASPVNLASLGGYAVWSATDTLGAVGGVVEVRAQLYTDTSGTPVFATAWVRVTVDSNGDGSAGTDIGPGSANLLTGDYSLSSTDTDELGLSAGRAASSRSPADGWLPMGERLSANQQQVSTDLSGFTVPFTSGGSRVTTLGQGETTPTASLEITAVSTSSNDTYAAVGGDNGALQLGMQTGRTYRMTGWIFVPAATGLVPGFVSRGLRIVGFYRDSGGAYHEVASAKANYVDAWQELAVDLPVPAGATEAFFRLYNGMLGGSGKKVYFDHLSMTEVVAPYGPSWRGGGGGGTADVDYTTLAFPEQSVARVSLLGGGWMTFSRNADGVTYTPEPGNEGMVLSKVDASTFRLTELDGTVSEFTQQGAAWTVTSTWTPESNSTARYLYDTTDSRVLLKKVVNPVEPGVDDTNHCTSATPARGCEVLEYVYATATTPGLSQTVFGDVRDHVSAVRTWSWDPDTGTETAVDVARYAYDDRGQLREVWDPRVSPALKTSYEYDGAGRVSKVTPAGQLPWMFDYGNPDVDPDALLRWNFDEASGGTVADASGHGRTGTFSGAGWGQGNDAAQPADGAATFTTASVQEVSAGAAVLNTTASFTVSAWVNLTDNTLNRTAVSQDGTRTSGFFLGYSQTTNRWTFSRVSADSDSSTAVRSLSDIPPLLGAWTHLVGVYDTTAGQMRLYVNGVLQSAPAPTGNWNATGAFVAGRAKWAGAATNRWSGGIDDVRAYQKVLSDDQVRTLAGDENPGRLLRVRRTALAQGSKTTTDGEIATNLVYHVPLTQSAGGPYNLNATAASTWGQSDLPTDATALFGPQDAPPVNSATPLSPGMSGFPYATVHYLGAGGQEVNTATPGGHIDTAEYDRFGNVVRSLEATDRELALGTLPGANAYLADLGLASTDTASRAMALSTVNTYSGDGTDLLDTLGPTVTMVLDRDLVDPNGQKPTLPAGSTVIGRPHTVNAYDQGKPDGAAYHLVTTETEGAQVVGYPDADSRVTTYGYNPDNGSASGWVLKKPTQVVADAGAGGAALTSHVVYDAAGRTLASWGIDSTGADARTSKTIYYTAGANPADAGCANQPEWAGQPCVTAVAAAPGTVDPARMSAELPVKRVNSYNRWGDVAVTTETVAGTSASRTTTTLYDAAGRVSSVQITSSGDGATQIPAVTTDYDPTSGEATVTHSGSATITREYDLWGRLYSYTDADGAATVNEFDRFGNATKVSDPTGNTTFGYDRTAEPRGLLTSVTDSVAGTFSASYSPDGQLTTLHYPGGMTRTDTLDANLEPATRTYTRDSDGAVVYSESIVSNGAGQAVTHTYTGGSKTYGYDRIGRLTSTRQVSSATAGCVTRTYSFDNRTNRTARKTYNPAADGTCASTAGTPDAEDDHSYDAADRITDAGFVYDPFGRITALPGGLTNSYYANDLVAGQVLADTRQDWTLDPAQRLRAFTTANLVNGAWVNATSKLNHYGDDSDEPRWIVEDTSLGAVTRMVSGPDGDLAATTSATGEVQLQIVNVHGDVAATIDTGLTTPAFNDTDEFGNQVGGQPTPRYGWLGGKQRSGEALGDVILMGVRLYHPALGRFLQVDPVPGGSATAYDYCNADPVNCTDLDGRWGWSSFKKALTVVATVASYASMIPGPIGTIAGVVSGVCYAATGNWAEAAWAFGGAAAALVGAGAAVKAAKVAVTAVRASAKAGRIAAFGARAGRALRATWSGAKAAGRGARAAARAVGRGARAAYNAVGRASRWAGGKVAAGARYVWKGYETKFGNNWRIAPFGNRVGGWYNRLPHYHRRGQGPGQGIGRHRPWQSSRHDRHWWNRF
jgi:RHS repeat-associated protein